MLSEIIIFLLAAFFAAVFATVAGFGSSTLLIPVAYFFMDIKTAVFIVACFHLFNNLFKVRLFFRNINYNIFWTFGTASIVAAFLGAKCIQLIPVEILKTVLGLFLIAFSIYSIWSPNFRIINNFYNSLLGGVLSGFLAGLIGLGGAIRSAFLISYNLKKEIYIATAALIALCVDIIRIPTYYFGGVVKENVYFQTLPLLILIALAGVILGKKLVTRINQLLFQRIVYIALILVGLKLLF